MNSDEKNRALESNDTLKEIWACIRREAEKEASKEPILASFFQACLETDRFLYHRSP